MYVFLAILLLGILIIAHEFGHFIAARLCGIDVVEFSMGMGPLLLKKKDRKGTQFSVRLLPIGGYCQFRGEDEEGDDPRAFGRQKVWKRFVTVLSGPAMNFLIAVLVIVVYLSAMGIQTIVPKAAQLEENAMQAGMMIGDEIIAVNGDAVTDTNMIAEAIGASGGNPVEIAVRRGGQELTLMIEPFYDEAENRYRIGITFDQERQRISLLESVPFSISYNIESVKMIVDTLRNLIFKGEGTDQVTGVVGTVYVIQDVTRQGGVDIYLSLLAMISVNLGVMNLLPIPGLDGSRLLFLAVEAVRRKPVKPEIEGAIHAAGFVLLMALTVLLTYQDVLRFF
ncbi:MAG: site-2 protease family protein [Clostridia bacterium]|nr:site-2 protease family protein [Clostridia bacterium]